MWSLAGWDFRKIMGCCGNGFNRNSTTLLKYQKYRFYFVKRREREKKHYSDTLHSDTFGRWSLWTSVLVPGVGAQTHGGEEGLAEGHGRGVRLQALPLRAGRRKSHAAQCRRQPSHRYEVREHAPPYRLFKPSYIVQWLLQLHVLLRV